MTRRPPKPPRALPPPPRPGALKTVRWRSPLEALRGPYRDEDLFVFAAPHRAPASADLLETYFKYARALNPTTLYATLLALALVGSPFSRLWLALFIALVALGAACAWIARRAAEGLEVRRRVGASSVVQGELLTIEYEVENTSAFPIFSLVLYSEFSGSSERVLATEPLEALAVGAKRPLKARARCDGGMGIHVLGPTLVDVSDPLGLFHFAVRTGGGERVRLLPRIGQAATEIPTQAFADALRYGAFETRNRGTSTNLRGIRDYSRGDPMKHVAWKLVAKHGRLLVKEFERQVNSEVWIVVEMDATLHLGEVRDSSWEAAKRVAIALLLEQARLGNSVTLATQGLVLSAGASPAGATVAVDRLLALELEPRFGLPSALEEHQRRVPKGATLVYVSPPFFRRRAELVRILRDFETEGTRCACFLIDSASFVTDLVRSSPAIALRGLDGLADYVEETRRMLRDAEIATYPVLASDAAALARPT